GYPWQGGPGRRQAPDDQEPRQHLVAPATPGARFHLLPAPPRRHWRAVRDAQAQHARRTGRVVGKSAPAAGRPHRLESSFATVLRAAFLVLPFSPCQRDRCTLPFALALMKPDR